MELRHLLYFKTVSEELHFRNAATKLFISQPPLSRQIKELEQELGVKLFERNNKRVLLTDAGRYFKKQVDELFATLEESKSIAKQIHENESGELNIGYISSVYQSRLADVLKQLQPVFPFVKTGLYERPTVKQIEALECGQLDVGILRAPVKSDKLVVKTLFFDPFMVVTPAIDTIDSSNLAAEIKSKPFIFFNQQYAPDYFDKLLEICLRLGFRPDIRHEANNVHSIIRLVEAGLGVSILPASIKEQYKNLKISCFELSQVPVRTEVVLAFRKENKNPVVDWFIEKYTG
ncbi:LysR family transcriptional regulator [Pedobacter sp. HMF7647]|uniref:LysR family transcriptional regulator n=1 Tax=Hufsiella arboris TaxID=2695275 RepID=A0A7K1Y5T8_9SPHI|nr:LysR family transcriptional regulator [Hufsiella arboris]MXV49771.1 LysR family transcriptional regulator [Hufsiella arboris]